VLACLTLVGAWSSVDSDQDVVARMAGRTWREVENELAAWITSTDPPFIQSGAGWRVVSSDGAWSLLHPSILPADLAMFADIAVEVLREPDPTTLMASDERIAASVQGIRRRYSPRLREGIAQGLALLGAFNHSLPDGSASEDYAERAVRDLLRQANQDASGVAWASLSDQLPLLAEAAPESFLGAIEEGLSGPSPVIQLMFADHRQDSLFATSSPHTGLLWAIEALCWSPQYLSSASHLLARLAEVDPDGKLANRPAGSLRAVFLPWRPQTSAPPASRLAVIDVLLKNHPGVAWALLMDLMPKAHDILMPNYHPRFRRWAPSDEPALPIRAWLEMTNELGARAMDLADRDPSRWADLVGNVDDLPPEIREEMLERLERLPASIADPELQQRLWFQLKEVVDRHMSFPDAEWALDATTVARLDAIGHSLAPSDPAQRYGRLFDWNPHIAGADRHNFDEYERALAGERGRAIREVVAHSGLDGVMKLAESSKIPEQVGLELAKFAHGRYAEGILPLLGRPDALGRMAHGWVHVNGTADSPWLQQINPRLLELHPEQQAAFVLALGSPTSSTLTLLAGLGEPVRERYWKYLPPYPVEQEHVPAVVENLLAQGRPWIAIDILALASHRAKGQPNANASLVPQVIAALDAGLIAGNASEGQHAASVPYEIGQLIDLLEQERVVVGDLVRLEWGYFAVLEHTRVPRALFAALGRDPEFFVDLVCRVYRAKNTPPANDIDDKTAAVARNAWHVLQEWRRPPGLNDDGSIDSTALRSWVRQARLMLSDRDRADIGDQQIGQVLSGAPSGADGLWPPEEIRELIEDLASRQLEVGLAIGKQNSRGVTSRGPYDGGDQERTLASEYRESATLVGDRWPRTGRLLHELASDYERLARREDAEAHSLADGI
jgi:hypothetical protein